MTRHPTLRRKLRRDLRRSLPQFLAVAVTVFIGLTLFGASRDAYGSLEASYDELFERLVFADLWVTGGDVDRFADDARALDGVEAVEVRHRADVPFRMPDGSTLVGRVVGYPAEGEPDVNRVLVTEGDGLDPSTPDGVLAEAHLADHFGLEPGDTFTITGASGPREVVVTGVASSTEYIWPARSRQELITTPDSFGVAFAADDRVADLGPAAVRQALVRYEPDAPAGLTGRLSALADDAAAVDVFTRAEQPSNSALQQDLSGLGDMAFLFPLLFLTAAGMGAWVLLTRVVVAQRATIGMLRANGMRRRTLFGHYLGFGVAAGVAGALPAMVLAPVLASWVAGFYTDTLMIPITELRLDWTTPVISLAFGVGAGALAAWAPSRRAMQLSPAEAMRGPAPTGPGKVTLLERLIPPLRRLPAPGLLVLRGVFRNPRRTFSTALGVVLSLVLIMSSWGMIDTVDALFERQFGDIQQDDAQVVLAGGADDAALERLAAVDGVATVEPVAALAVAVEVDGDRYGTELLAYRPDTTMRRFLDGDAEVALPETGVLVGRALTTELGVEVGDEVTLRIPELDVAVTDTIAGFVTESLGTRAYVSLPHLRDQVAAAAPGAAVPTAALVRYADGADPTAVEARLGEVDGVLAVTPSDAVEQAFQQYLALFYGFVGIMLVFGGILAFALIFNSMSVAISERTVEVATMEASGVPQRRIARLITAENLAVTVLGIVPGLLLGWLAADAFLGTYSTDQISFDLVLRWYTPLLAAGIIVVVALVSQRPGLRAVARLDIAQVVRERAL